VPASQKIVKLWFES